MHRGHTLLPDESVLSHIAADVPDIPDTDDAGEEVSGEVSEEVHEEPSRPEDDIGSKCEGIRPIMESESINSVARKNSLGDVLHEVPVYNHYFGLALYDLLQTVTQ